MIARWTCAETFARLDDYLDRELTADDLASVQQHLDECVICAEEFGVEQSLLDALRAKLSQVRLPAGLRERIAERLLRE